MKVNIVFSQHGEQHMIEIYDSVIPRRGEYAHVSDGSKILRGYVTMVSHIYAPNRHVATVQLVPR